MDAVLPYILIVTAYVLSLVGILGAIVPVVPGVVISWLALLCLSFVPDVRLLPWYALLIWFVIVVLVMLADYILPALLTRLAKGSKAGTWGAAIGSVAGFILSLVVGTFFLPLGILMLILGPMLGAVLGELLRDSSDVKRALMSGLASGLSFIIGVGLKAFVSVAMFLYLNVALWWEPIRCWLS